MSDIDEEEVMVDTAGRRTRAGRRKGGGVRASNLLLPGHTQSVVLFNRALEEKIEQTNDGDIGEEEIRALLKKLLSQEKKTSQYQGLAGGAIVLLILMFVVTFFSTIIAVRLSKDLQVSSVGQLVNTESGEIVSTQAVGGGSVVVGEEFETLPLFSSDGSRRLVDDENGLTDRERQICRPRRFAGMRLQATMPIDDVLRAVNNWNKTGGRSVLRVRSEKLQVLDGVFLTPGSVYNVGLNFQSMIETTNEEEGATFYEHVMTRDDILQRDVDFSIACPKNTNKKRCCIYSSITLLQQKTDRDAYRKGLRDMDEAADNAEEGGRALQGGW